MHGVVYCTYALTYNYTYTDAFAILLTANHTDTFTSHMCYLLIVHTNNSMLFHVFGYFFQSTCKYACQFQRYVYVYT